MKLLVDANLSPDWVAWLKSLGFEAARWYAVGIKSASDMEIMAFAAEHGFTVLTRDLDFGTMLLQLEATRPSVIQIRANPADPSGTGDQVVRALRALEPELASGALVTVDPKRVRARLLPFRRTDL